MLIIKTRTKTTKEYNFRKTLVKYENKQLLRIKAGSDNYGSRSTQSLNYEPKQKNLETMKVNTIEKETFAAEWDIQDTHKEKQLNFEEQTTKEM